MISCNQAPHKAVVNTVHLNAKDLKKHQDFGRLQRSLIFHKFLKKVNRRMKFKRLM